MENSDSPSDTRSISSIEKSLIQAQTIEILRTCFDPEIPVNVYDMGLIYDVAVDDGGGVTITMTLTTPHCPVAQSLPKEIETKAQGVPGVAGVKVDVVWDPPWNPSMMTEAAKLELGMS